MIIAVASGKGGTGKTTISTSLAISLKDLYPVQLIDCDVEEPNSSIFVKPESIKVIDANVLVPQINKNKCNFCGLCQEICEYNALVVLKDNVIVLPELCHSCGGCALLCPEKAITEVERGIGKIEVGYKNEIEIISGRLNIGEAQAVPLIKMVKKYIDRKKQVIIDAPPGTSCPVIESVRDSDYVILVTEPTPFGLNDLKLAVSVMREIEKPFGVVINRYDEHAVRVEKYCNDENIEIIMTIPFDRKIAEGYSRGQSLVEVRNDLIDEFRNLFKRIENSVVGKEPHDTLNRS